MTLPSPLRGGWLLVPCVLLACRKGSEQVGSFVPVIPSPFGTQGCSPLASVPSPADAWAIAGVGPKSQIVAAVGSETLYLTAGDGSVHRLDVPGAGAQPIDTELVAPGTFEASYPAGLMGSAELSGIAILDTAFLVVADHTSNTLFSVRRDVPNSVQPLAGLPLGGGGFSDGAGGSIRFHFTEAVSLLADASGFVMVGDTENHALRKVLVAGFPTAATVTGTGAPGGAAGALTNTQLDTPSGLASSCGGELLVTESGRAGLGGNRLLSLAIGSASFFGGFDGLATVLAGDGTNETTEGVGRLARLGTPQGLASSADGRVFWVDAKEGILRRFDLPSGVCDCPLFASCAAAVSAGGTFDGDHFSLALGDSGSLYILEADAGMLHRIDP